MRKSIKTIYLLIIFVFCVSLLGPAATVAGSTPANVHPYLLQLASEEPDQMVSVIVQKTGLGGEVEAAVARLGGQLTKDLHIIRAFAAEMNARSAVALGRHPGVRWVSLDAPVERAGKSTPPPPLTTNTYLDTLGVPNVWNLGITGDGIGVAVIDSGVTNNQDLPLKRSVSFAYSTSSDKANLSTVGSTMMDYSTMTLSSVHDYFGHGTHVAGILGGNGTLSSGKFKGVATGIDLISLKVCDNAGMAYESDVVTAIQWVYDNKSQYNIRVVNLSLNSTVEQSYHTSPLDAAVEILWFNGVVVVVSSGNSSGGTNYANTPPANDPFVITVGAADEKATSAYTDDAIAPYTSWTITANGYLKPDIFAPGSNIISNLSDFSSWDETAPERVVDTYYFRLSGTSMAAPMVTGAVALLLQDEPNLTPDQVKYRLLNATSRKLTYKMNRVITYTWPYLDVYATVTGTTTGSSNTGLTASQLLWSGTDPITWGSVAWNSVAWNSVAWNSVAWNSVAWNSVAWNSMYWGP